MTTLFKGCIFGKMMIDLTVHQNLTVIMGNSGSGKTYIFNILKKIETTKKTGTFMFIDASDRRGLKELGKTTGKIILIDNADVILNDKDRLNIRRDSSNYYLIFGRDVSLLGTGSLNIAEIKHDENKLYLHFKYKDRALC